ncbi:MAG: hypothetical protein WD022_11875 [Balneolaceae bacterium]
MKKILATISVLCFITGCKYSPSGSNYIERSQEVIPIVANLSVSPVLEIEDTLKVFGYIDFHYDIDVGNKQVYSFEFWLDDDSHENNWGSQSWNLTGSHSLYTNNYEDGEHTIHIKLITSSGRENIADKLDTEFLETRFAIPLWFDNGPASPVSVTKVNKEAGRIQVNWEMYRRPDLEEYRVYKMQTIDGFYNSEQYVGTSESRELTSIIDPQYIGGKVNYRVDVKIGHSYKYSNGEPFTYSGSYPQFISADTVGSNQLQIKWTSCKYPANFGKYEIYNSTINQEWTIDNVNDTTVSFQFSDNGTPHTLILSTHPEGNNNFRNVRQDTLYIN